MRQFSGFALAVLLAALLASCGGGDGSGGAASTASQPPAETAERAAAPSGSGTEEQGRKRSQAGDEGQQGAGGDVSSNSRATPLRVSGGGSRQFRSKSGDNSVQEYGEEASGDELRQAAEAVHSFYVARAEGDWTAACARLSQSLLGRIEALAKKSIELADTSCPSFLKSFTADLTPAEWREVTTVDAGSLRHDGEQAFLIYYGPSKQVYAMPLASEDGAWKVNALSSDPLG